MHHHLLRRLRGNQPSPGECYLVIRGNRVCFASRERSLAEAYFHGQDSDSALLVLARVLRGAGINKQDEEN